MQVSVENTGPLERKLHIEVPEEKIAAEVQNRLQSLSRTSKIQGFRPGKAPLKVVEKKYGSKVRQEVIGEVVQSSFFEALNKENLRPASRPTIDPMNAEQGRGLVYTATFEVYPEIQQVSAEKLKIEKPVCEVSDADVEQMIETIRKQKRDTVPVERAAKAGDILTVDFKGTLEGKPFDGGEASDFKLELGSNRFIAGFEDGLLGAEAGEDRSLDLTFPEDYPRAELAGKSANFAVTVKEVTEPVLPELNDEFFAGMGIKEGGLETFRAEIRRNMEREVEQTLHARAKSAVLESIYQANKVELPRALVRKEAERLNSQLMNNLKMRGIDPGDSNNEAEIEALTPQAEKNVSLQLLVADIIKTQKIKAEPSQVREIIEKVARGYEDPNEVINWYYGDKQRLAEVEALALEDEVVKWVLSRAKVTEKQISFDDLMNKVQTETN